MAHNVTIRGLGTITKKLQRLADGKAVSSAFVDVGQRARRWVADWYRRRGDDWFDTPDSPTHGPGREETRWAHTMMLQSSWQVERASSRSYATAAVRLVFKSAPEKLRQFLKLAEGGSISVKRAQALTIPIVPEAHGLSVAEYSARFGKRLFRPKGKDYLAENNFGELRVVYLLRKSVYIKPMRARNGHEPYAWREPRFKSYIMEQMRKILTAKMREKA